MLEFRTAGFAMKALTCHFGIDNIHCETAQFPVFTFLKLTVSSDAEGNLVLDSIGGRGCIVQRRAFQGSPVGWLGTVVGSRLVKTTSCYKWRTRLRDK